MSGANPPFSGASILIVGSGVFGASTALALAKHAHPPASITIVDRRPNGPGPHSDAASADVSKIIRSDYGASSLYGDLATAAIAHWRDPSSIYHAHFHRVGYLAYSTSRDPQDKARAYVEGSIAKLATTKALSSAEAIRTASTLRELAGSFADQATVASFNDNAGWAHATGGCHAVVDELRGIPSVRFVSGLVTSFVVEDGAATGVRFEDGSTIDADLVISCAGAWTPSLLPELADDDHVAASGQYIAHLSLTDVEAERLRDMPVILNTDTGVYCFPPNPHYGNLLKVAVHGPGYGNAQPSLADASRSVSTPRTRHYGGGEQLEIPDEASQTLRTLLATIAPSLVAPDRNWLETRLCWYADTQDSHWLLDYHPSIKRLFVATGDSDHGYKFLPIMGDLICSALAGSLPPDQQRMWSWARKRHWRESEDMRGDLARARRPLPPVPAAGR